MKFVLAVLLSGLVGVVSYHKKWLSLSGSLAAFLLGIVYFGLGSYLWYTLLLFFFVSSSILTKRKGKEQDVLEKDFEKSGRRDMGQVLANGGGGVLLLLNAHLFPSYAFLFFIAYAGVMATVTGDTWATEMGIMSKKAPIHILTGKPVARGESGGITFLGTMMSLCGSFLIALLGVFLLFLFKQGQISPFSFLSILLIITFAGFIGALADSLLGATLQRMFRCPHCGKVIETKTHCGVPATRFRGIDWFSNDWVNFTSSLTGGLLSVLFSLLFQPSLLFSFRM